MTAPAKTNLRHAASEPAARPIASEQQAARLWVVEQAIEETADIVHTACEVLEWIEAVTQAALDLIRKPEKTHAEEQRIRRLVELASHLACDTGHHMDGLGSAFKHERAPALRSLAEGGGE